MSGLTRSVVFTALLDLSPVFCAMSTRDGSEVITDLVADWEKDTSLTDLYAFAKQWLVDHPLDDDTRITLPEAGRLLGVHPNTVRNWVIDGKIPSTRTAGGQRRMLRSDILALRESLTEAKA